MRLGDGVECADVLKTGVMCEGLDGAEEARMALMSVSRRVNIGCTGDGDEREDGLEFALGRRNGFTFGGVP